MNRVIPTLRARKGNHCDLYTGATPVKRSMAELDEAKARHRPFQEVLQHYGLERLLYRLARSPHRERFLLKGALLLNAWKVPRLTSHARH